MKRLNYLLGLLLLGALVFTSCEDDETEKPPTLSFKGGADYVSTDSDVTVGDEFIVGITATPNLTSQEKLVRLTVTRTFNNLQTTVIDSTLDKLTSLSLDIIFEARETAGEERIEVEVEDKNGEIAELELVITTVEEAEELYVFNAVLLGAQDAAAGSTASLEDGTIYTISGSDAANNSESVDIVHFNGAKDVALYSPSNSDIQGVSLYGISDWTTKNSTKLSKTSLTVAEFNDITTTADLGSAGTPTGDFVGFLAVDDVVVFETASGLKGVFMVTALVDATDGSVTIKVKVE